MFIRPFDSTASFAATAYDSALNLFTAFPVSDVAASLTSTNDPTRFTGLTPQFLNQSSQSGRFTVGSSGQLQIDYLFDGGAYEGELALFNLSGLESLEPGSTAFIQEAARRALSGSDLGYVLIQDGVESAKFSGVLDNGENLNAGSYLGTKLFNLTPGTQFGLMLVPNGTVQQVFEHPEIEGAFHPLFSLASANRNSAVQLGQLSDQGQAASIFAWEDLQVNGWSDRDFNDLVFRLDGAIGGVPTLDSLIDPGVDWRESAGGQQIAASEPFNIELVLGDGFTESQKAIINAAKISVEAMITQGLPDVLVDGQWVDDVRFQLSVEALDGTGGIWAQTRLDRLREGTLLPAQSITQLDGADLAELERSGKLFGVIQHELLEGLGLGTLWQQKGLIDESVGQYIGTQAVDAFHQLGGVTPGVPVQRSSAGGSGLYWNEGLFQNEVMTADLGFQRDGAGNLIAPVSPVTLAALADLGYQVDLSQATLDYELMARRQNTLAQSMHTIQTMQLFQSPLTGDDSASNGWAYGGEGEIGNTAGQPTIFWRNYATGQNVVWGMDGSTLAIYENLPTVPDPGWVIGALGDFSGDGKIDILWRHQNGATALWYMDGLSLVDYSEDFIDPVPPHWGINGTGDFNQDGVLDLLWRDYQTGATTIWLREATGKGYTSVSLPQRSLDWAIQGVGDFTNDGKPDILWRNYATGATVVWQMDSTTMVDVLPLPQGTIDPSWVIQGVGDFDRDGQANTLWRNYVGGYNALWAMDGLVWRSSVWLTPIPDLSWQIEDAAILTMLSPSGLGLIGGGSVTHQAMPTVVGQAVPWAVVKLYANGLLVGQGRAGSDGAWQVTSSPLGDGSYSLTATAMDALGVISQPSMPLAITVDTIPPTTPTIQLLVSSDTGISNTDFITQDSTPTFSGTAEVGSVVQLYRDGTLIAQPTVDANGAWQFTSTALGDGTYTFTATTTDAAGNVSSASAVLTITVDTQPPTPPTNIKVASLTNSSFVGSSQPLVSGRAQPNTLVKLFSDGQLIGQTMVAGNGTWYTGSNTALAQGLQAFTATSTDAAGNESPASEPLQITIDTTAPYFYLSESLESFPLTPETRLTGYANGTFSPLAVLKYQFDTLPPISISVNPDGTFNQLLDLTSVEDGAHTLILTAFDQAGIGTSQQFDVITSKVPPDFTAPVIVASLDHAILPGGANAVQVTSNPGVSGFLTDDATIAVFQARFDDSPSSSFTNIKPLCQTDGSFTLDGNQLNAIYGGTLPDGVHTLHLQAQDEFGNLSNTTLTFTLDTTAPTIPTVTLLETSDTGISQTDRVTQDTTPTLTGTAEPGTTVQIEIDQVATAQILVDTNGSWQYTPTSLPDGAHQLTAIAVDGVGNPSTVSELTVTVDTTVPSMEWTVPAQVDANTHLTGWVNGTGSEIATFTYRIDDGTARDITWNPDGSFDLLLDLTGLRNGVHTLTLTTTDRAGNEVIQSRPVSISTGPIVSAGLLHDTGMGSGDGITNDPTIRGMVNSTEPVLILVGFEGTDEADWVDVSDLIDAQGFFTLDLAQLEGIAQEGLPDGNHTLRMQVQDAQGQELQTLSVPFKLDTASPDLGIDGLLDGIAWNQKTLSGQVIEQPLDAGTRAVYTITKLNSAEGGSSHTVMPNFADGKFFESLNLPQEAGSYVLRVNAVDAAGNVSYTDEYTFLVPDNTPVVDDDPFIGMPMDNPLPPNPPNPPNSPSPPGGSAGPGGIWGYVGSGGGWGFWNGTDWTPSPNPFPGDSDGSGDSGSPNPDDTCNIALSYQDRIKTILEYGAGSLSTEPDTIHKKAALINRTPLLKQIAQVTETYAIYQQMQPVMHGIFNDAAGMSTQCQAINEGYILAQDIAKDDTAVKVQTFQTELFAAVYGYLKQNQQLPNSIEQKRLDSALLSLGETFAKLKLNQIGSNATTPGFLEQLWQLQMNADSPTGLNSKFQQSTDALMRSLQGADDPVGSVVFVSNLLQAATNVASLSDALRDDNFVQRLTDFGFKFAEFGSIYGTGEPMPFVFNHLWFGCCIFTTSAPNFY